MECPRPGCHPLRGFVGLGWLAFLGFRSYLASPQANGYRTSGAGPSGGPSTRRRCYGAPPARRHGRGADTGVEEGDL